MPICSRNGCKREYIEDDNKDEACTFHSGQPVFHEGLKYWSCCPNKKELEFDQFMKVEGCGKGPHLPTPEKPPKELSKPSIPLDLPLSSEGGTEVFASGPSVPKSISQPSTTPKPANTNPAFVEEEDDSTVDITPGTQCRRNGCKVEFVSNEENRHGDGDGTVCTYHPGAPIFHEGSKGYFCCKRRVLEFDEFLKIEGCKKGRHLFARKKRSEDEAEVQASCRIDHYQTPQQVCVSIFAKQADKSRSTVVFEEEKVLLDLYLPGSKRFTRILNLYGPIRPDESNFMIMGTKVELNLQKKDGRSWNLLEKSDIDLGGFALTFGVGGRTGTIGGKEAVLSSENKDKASTIKT